MNRGKCFLFLLSGLILVVIIAFVACGQREVEEADRGGATSTDYIHYLNEEHGYSLDYPSNWVLDSSDARSVLITPVDSPMHQNLTVFVWASESLEDSVNFALTTARQTLGDFTLLSSEPLDDTWDWFLGGTYIDSEFREVHYQQYLKATNNFQYTIIAFYELDSTPVEMQRIIDSFSVIASSPYLMDEETQEVLDFIEDLKPIAEADVQLGADYNDFAMRLVDMYAQIETLQEHELEALQAEALAEVKEFIKRAGDIYIEIGQLDAPQPCRTVQYKWKEAYECRMEGLSLLRECLVTGDSDTCNKSDELLIKSNLSVTEAKYELDDIASAYGIEMQWK